MNYLKWLVVQKHRQFFVSADWVGPALLNMVIIMISFLASLIAGILLCLVSLAFWAIPAFFFAQEAFQQSITEYDQDIEKYTREIRK